jgi:hypothetical protein
MRNLRATAFSLMSAIESVVPSNLSQKNMPVHPSERPHIGLRTHERPPYLGSVARTGRWDGPRGEASEVPGGRLLEHVAPLSVKIGDEGGVGAEARHSPLAEQREEQRLGEAAGVQERCLPVQRNPVDQRPRACDHSQPQARRYDLGEAVKAKHAAVRVHRKQTRRRRRCPKLEVIVRICIHTHTHTHTGTAMRHGGTKGRDDMRTVFEDEEVVGARERIDRLFACRGQAAAARIAAVRDGVEKLGRPDPTPRPSM